MFTLYPRPRCSLIGLTFIFSVTGLRIDEKQGEVRAAVCFAGQFRSFLKTVQSATDNLLSAFSHPDVFLFLNLQDSGKGGNANHANDIDKILEVVSPVSHKYYNESDFDAVGSTLQEGSSCFRKRGTEECCHFSWHGTQIWGIQQCWDTVKKHEKDNRFRYEYFVRARPDTNFPERLHQAIQTVTKSQFHGGTQHAWLPSFSDTFTFLTRGAADAYGDTFKNTFIGDSCTRLPAESLCGPMMSYLPSESRAIGISTNCLLVRNMLSGGVQLHFDAGFAARPIVRP